MKFSILTLALALGLSSTASANVSVPTDHKADQKLMAALHNLSNRAEIQRHTYLHTPRQISKYAMFGGLGIALADALRADRNWAAVRKAPRLGSAIFLAGVAAYAIVGAQRYVAVPQRMHDPHVVETAVDLMYFFARPISEQYEIAKDNEPLKALIYEMNDNYDYIDKAMNTYKRPPAQFKSKAG